MNLCILPRDVISEIFTFLEFKEWVALRGCCRLMMEQSLRGHRAFVNAVSLLQKGVRQCNPEDIAKTMHVSRYSSAFALRFLQEAIYAIPVKRWKTRRQTLDARKKAAEIAAALLCEAAESNLPITFGDILTIVLDINSPQRIGSHIADLTSMVDRIQWRLVVESITCNVEVFKKKLCTFQSDCQARGNGSEVFMFADYFTSVYLRQSLEFG